MHVEIKQTPHPQPHEMLIHGVFVIQGVLGVISPQRFTGPTLVQLPISSLYLFYAVLAGGSLGVTVGSLLANRTGQLIHLYGSAIVAIDIAGYGIAILSVSGLRGILFGLLTIGISCANLVTVWLLLQDLRWHRLGKSLLWQRGSQ